MGTPTYNLSGCEVSSGDAAWCRGPVTLKGAGKCPKKQRQRPKKYVTKTIL